MMNDTNLTNFSLLHPNDLLFIESLDSLGGHAPNLDEHELYTSLRSVLLQQPNMNAMGHTIRLLNELGASALASYQRLRIDLFYVILAHLTRIAYPGFMAGTIPTYVTEELFSERNIRWMNEHGCLYIAMNDLTFLDVMCMVYTIIKKPTLRITDEIICSNTSYIRDSIYELSNAVTIEFRVLYRNICYWRCLLDSFQEQFKPDATSIADYSGGDDSFLHRLLVSHMPYYVTFLKTCYQAENEYHEFIKGMVTSDTVVNSILRRQIRERILLCIIIQSAIKRLTRPNLFIQAIQWMARRWIDTRALTDDPYLGTDYSLQISALTNIYQVIHRSRSSVYRDIEPYTNSLYNPDDVVILNSTSVSGSFSCDTEDVMQFREAYDITKSIADVWTVIFDVNSSFNIHLKCQSVMTIPHIVWVNIARHTMNKHQLYKNMFNTYILLENYNEHTGFSEQLDFRNFIVTFLLSCQWTTPADIVRELQVADSSGHSGEVEEDIDDPDRTDTDTDTDESEPDEDDEPDEDIEADRATDESDDEDDEPDEDVKSTPPNGHALDSHPAIDCRPTDNIGIFQWLETLHESMLQEGLQFIVISNAHIVRLLDMYDKTIHGIHNVERHIVRDQPSIREEVVAMAVDKLRAIVRYVDIHILTLNTMTQFLLSPSSYERYADSPFFRWWINAIIDTMISVSKISQLEHFKEWMSDTVTANKDYIVVMNYLWKGLSGLIRITRDMFVAILMVNSNMNGRTSATSATSTLFRVVHPDIQDWFQIINATTDAFEKHVLEIKPDKIVRKSIENIHQIYTKYEPRYTDAVPSEFLDSILFTEIYHPIELPDTRTLVDDWSILKHVLIEQTNPYTRKTLTLQTLLEYQNREDVRERIREYNEKWTEWRTAHLKASDDDRDATSASGDSTSL